MRLEVAAGAVLEPTKNPTAGSAPGDARALIVWDGAPGSAPHQRVDRRRRNQARTSRTATPRTWKPGWDLSHSFVFDLDPRRTGGSNILGAMQLFNVRGFLIQNVFSVQNGSAQSGAGPHGYAAPTSSRAVITLEPRNDSPKAGPFYDPRDGTIVNHYNIGGPFGYGPNQISSAHKVTFDRIFSNGGVALRLETDATLRKSFGGQVNGLLARDIVGVNCNRAVAVRAARAEESQRARVRRRREVVPAGCDRVEGRIAAEQPTRQLHEQQRLVGPGRLRHQRPAREQRRRRDLAPRPVLPGLRPRLRHHVDRRLHRRALLGELHEAVRPDRRRRPVHPADLPLT